MLLLFFVHIKQLWSCQDGQTVLFLGRLRPPINPIALRKAKIVYNFGLFECNRVNKAVNQYDGMWSSRTPKDQCDTVIVFDAMNQHQIDNVLRVAT